jgi:hypothetical protein
MTAAIASELACSVHEAGHGVIACANGWTVKELVLHQPGSRATKAGEGGYCALFDQLDVIDANPFSFMVYTLAGGSAEKRASSGRHSSRDGGDREQAANLALLMCEWDASSPRIAQLLHSAERLADARLLDDTIWTWTENVARALMIRHRLTGAELQELHPRGRR